MASAVPAYAHVPFIRPTYKWDEKFTTRRERYMYDAEDQRPDLSNCTKLSDFIKIGQDTLDPPELTCNELRAFLDSYNTVILDYSKRILLDDRRDDSAGDARRDYEADGGRNTSIPSHTDRFRTMNTTELSRRLKRFRKVSQDPRIDRGPTEAERRIIFIVDPTAADASTLIRYTSGRNLRNLQELLHKYVTRRAYVGVSMNHTPLMFAFELHLPFFAVRSRNDTDSDPRKVDASSLRKSLDLFPSDLNSERAHEAQVSMLLHGVDEWFWTVYFLVDAWFGSGDDAPLRGFHQTESDSTVSARRDGPTGQAVLDWREWDPREYFLLVASTRYRQVRKEWCNTADAFEARLSPYERDLEYRVFGKDSLLQFNQSRDPWSDEDFRGISKRIEEYSCTASTLRVFNKSLTNLIDSWTNFSSRDMQYFTSNVGRRFDTVWKGYITSIEHDVAELAYLRNCFEQRIKMFDQLENSLVNRASLFESRAATDQGRYIERLTRVTVWYLPITLVTGIFGMSILPNTSASIFWIAYILSVVILTAFTVTRTLYWDAMNAKSRLFVGKAEETTTQRQYSAT